jgi:ATP-dependent RNA helicase DeaD
MTTTIITETLTTENIPAIAAVAATPPAPSVTFDQFGLPANLAANLAAMQYKDPTPIQAQAIPLALQGKDILGSAQTGTGKTAAFGIPLVTRIMSSPRGSALVLTPTRELATQVFEVIQQLLGKRSFIPSVLLIGGDSMNKQCAQLRFRPRIIVGTPGRINDHLERGNLILHDTSFLVLDETDRMLDMGFGIQIDRILKFLPQSRQTLMFSATLPDAIVKMSAKYLHQPERIAVGSSNKPILKIQQDIIHVTDGNKFDELITQLKKREGSIIMFVKTKRGADRMADRLNKLGHKADTIHGDLHQRKRERVIQGFRDMKFRILVATDIAARGLDISHIEHVINYDLPQCPEDYIHRIGRTARNGSEGASVCLIAPEDNIKWKAIHRMLHPGEPTPHLPGGTPSPRGRGGYKGKPSGSGGGNRRSFGDKKPGNGNGGSGNSGGGGNRRFKRAGKRPGASAHQAA